MERNQLKRNQFRKKPDYFIISKFFNICIYSFMYFLLMAFISLPAIGREGFNITKQGKPETAIVLSDSPASCVKAAAKELQYHVKRASGATLEIIKESDAKDPDKTYIFLGNTNALQKLGIDTKKFKYGQFIIKVNGNNLYLAGRDGKRFWLQISASDNSTGTLFAVYELLQRFLNVRWLWPGKIGEIIPKNVNITIPQTDEVIVPVISQKRLREHYGPVRDKNGWKSQQAYKNFFKEQQIWLKRHGFGWDCTLDMHHAFARYWMRFGKTNPDYFNLLPDGTRCSDPLYEGGPAHYISMCVSQPAFWKQIIADWKKKRTADNPYLDISENDTAGKCTCKACLAWDSKKPCSSTGIPFSLEKATEEYTKKNPKWFEHLGSLSDRYAKFYLAVQKEAEKVDPNVKLLGFAYANYVDPPVSTRLNDRIVIGFVPQVMFPWTSKKRKNACTGVKGWGQTGAQIVYRPNYLLDGHNMPIFYARKMAEDFAETCRHSKVIGTDFDSLTGQYATQGINLYVLARLNQNPALKVDDILDEYYSGFGKAKKQIKEYFEFWEKVSDKVTDEDLKAGAAEVKSPEGGNWVGFYLVADCVFTPKTMQKGAAILARAALAAKGDKTAMQRIAFLQKGLKNARLTLKTEVEYRKYKEHPGAPEAFSRAIESLDSFRHTIENDCGSNLGYLNWLENRHWNRSHLELLKQGGKDLPATWKFMWDPKKTGVNQKWYASDFNDSKWYTGVSVNQVWETQAVGKQWQQKHNRSYDGIAWYRNRFTVNSKDAEKRIVLVFGAVDEACTVWINGTKVLERPYPYQGNKDSWKEAFKIDITKLIVSDKENVVAVRVEDNSGAGGIWGGVQLQITTPLGANNAVQNPSFEDGKKFWGNIVNAGKFKFSLDSSIANSGTNSAKIECTAIDPKGDGTWRKPYAWARWTQKLKVEKGAKYHFRCFVRTEKDFKGRISIYITGNEKPSTIGLSAPCTGGRWIELKNDKFKAKGDTAGIYLNQYGKGTVWFDDVEMVKID